MASSFTLLATHMQAVLRLPDESRDAYIHKLPPEIAHHVRDLLQFKDATLDLSQVGGVELALGILAEPTPIAIGRWRVVQPLGRGGMASVYLVERSEATLRQTAACKVGYAQTDLEDGLRRETSTLLDLGHPGIAKVLDFGQTDSGRPFMVSELVDGTDLVSHAKANASSLTVRLTLFEEVLSAVAHAHERLVLHQDLKPENILVDRAGRPRLIDFGLATMLSGAGDAPVLGYTPRFASPEQKRNGVLTVRSDIYSLGVTLAALLDDLKLPSDHDARHVLEKACRESPEDRYGSAAAMAADIRAIVELRPVTVRPASLDYRMRRFVQRHPLPMAFGFLAVAALSVGLFAYAGQARRAIEAARTAEAAAFSSRAVQEFLIEDILGRANPADPEFDSTTGITGLIDSAAAAVDQRFARDPLAAAAVHGALASIYRSMGRFDVSVTHAAASARMYEEQLGETHELTLTSRYVQVRSLSSTQSFDEATNLIEATDRLAGDRLNEETPLALTAAAVRALLEDQQLRGAEALASYERAMALHMKIDPDDTITGAFLTMGLAEAYLRMQQPAKAISVWENHSLALTSKAHQANGHRMMARAYRDLKLYDEAMKHGLLALEKQRALFGNDNYSTLIALSTLSHIHHLRDDCAAALEAGREAYDGMVRVYGATRQATLIERGNFGSKQFECDQQEAGLDNVLASAHGLREHYGNDNSAAHSFTFFAAQYFVQLQRYKDALDQLDRLPVDVLRGEDASALLEQLREDDLPTELRPRGAALLQRVAES